MAASSTTGTAALRLRTEEVLTALRRHAEGDWGDLLPEDAIANDLALKHGGRLFSAYGMAATASGSSPTPTAPSPPFYSPTTINRNLLDLFHPRAGRALPFISPLPPPVRRSLLPTEALAKVGGEGGCGRGRFSLDLRSKSLGKPGEGVGFTEATINEKLRGGG